MVGWHHRLDGHEFEQALGVGEGQESLACCSPWGHKESDTIERLINKKTVGEMGSEKMGRREPEKESQVDRRGRWKVVLFTQYPSVGGWCQSRQRKVLLQGGADIPTSRVSAGEQFCGGERKQARVLGQAVSGVRVETGRAGKASLK